MWMATNESTGTGTLRDLQYLLLIKQATSGGTTLNELLVMQYILCHPGCRQRDIMECCDIPRSTISRILIDMESDRWVIHKDHSYRVGKRALAARQKIIHTLYSLPTS